MSSTDLAPPLPVALCLQGRRVLMVGGGLEAQDKLPKLLAAGAIVQVVADSVPESVAQAARSGAISWWARAFVPSDLRGADVVLLVTQDAELAAELRAHKRHHGYLLGAIDQPAVSDFFLMSIVTRGPVQIAISTGGRAPLLARTLRRALSAGLNDDFTAFAERMAALRVRHRALPKPERITRLSHAIAGFALELRLRYPEALSDGADVQEPTDAARLPRMPV